MATVEERLTLVEQEYAALLNTLAVGALVNKATLEQLNKRYDKLFDVLMNDDRFTNTQLVGIRGQVTGLEGKFAGLQTKMVDLEGKFVGLQTKMVDLEGKFVGLQTETRQGFVRLEGLIAQVIERLP